MTNSSASDQPNLFSFATSELSQDAFICWLAAWADPQYEQIDVKLHETARSFIGSMIHKIKPDFDPAVIKTIDIERQVGKLDVLIEVNKGLPDKLAILVEDKTHTSNHHDQLNRYYGQVSKDYGADEMIPLYFKTGYQSRFDTLGAFKPYLRKDFLKVLQQGQAIGVQNAIFADFLAHLEQMEWVISQFAGKPLNDWKDNDWRGFYTVLYESLKDYGGDWGHVNNPSGGFLGFWWYGIAQNSLFYSPYLQLETAYFNPNYSDRKRSSMSFKISVKEKSLASVAWSEASEKIDQAGKQLNTLLTPAKRSSGYSMTIARWSGDYLVESNGKLDFNATLANLIRAQEVLSAAFKSNDSLI